MAVRQEAKVWEVPGEEPEVFLPEGEWDIEEEAQELGEFLENGPINFININSVIPSLKFGVIYSATIGIIESTDRTRETVTIGDTFTFDNRTFDWLELETKTFTGEDKSDDEKIKSVRKNLFLIDQHILEPFNWPAPFNTRDDN